MADTPIAPLMTGVTPSSTPGAGFRLFIPEDGTGISHWVRTNEDGSKTYAMHQSGDALDTILDKNHAMATENSGWSGDKMMRRAGSIPLSVLYLWKTVEGWDPFRLDIPENMKKMKQKLNDRGLYKFRTAEWTV